MEDFENYKIFFYILIAILYFLFSGKKKPGQVAKKQEPKKEVVAQRPVSSHTHKTMGKKTETAKKTEPFTLEDVLKEFGNTLKEKPIVEKKVTKKEEVGDAKPVVVDYDENLEDEEDVYTRKKKRRRKETIVPEQDQHFVPYSLGQQQENKYAAIFSNPESLKNAFIAKEILDRRHF